MAILDVKARSTNNGGTAKAVRVCRQAPRKPVLTTKALHSSRVCVASGAALHRSFAEENVRLPDLLRSLLHAACLPPLAFAFSSIFSLSGGGLGKLWNVVRKRRRRRERRAAKRAEGMVRFSVVTFNVRAIMDRWPERLPILKDCLEKMSPDVVAFQEVLTGEFGQDVMLIGQDYRVHACRAALENLIEDGGARRSFAHCLTRLLSFWPTRAVLVALPLWVETIRERYHLEWDWVRTLRDILMAPFFGNSVATRLSPEEAREIEHHTLVLGNFRAAHRLSVSVKGKAPDEMYRVWIVNCHLDHDLPDTRVQQAQGVCAWMETQKEGYAAIVLCGDLNAAPGEAIHGIFEGLGYASAHRSLKGHEPQVTWPTGIKAPFAEEGEADCLDYIYIWQADNFVCRVVAADVCGDVPAAHDKTLYPSDHAALKVTVEVERLLPHRRR